MFIDLRLAIGSRSSGAQCIEEHVNHDFAPLERRILKEPRSL
jgi:hypothetical protein